MKTSRTKVELKLDDIEIMSLLWKSDPQVSEIQTATVDESRGLQSTWQASVVYADSESQPRVYKYTSFFDINLLNFKDFQNENIVAFGTAYIDGDNLDETFEIDLPLRYLNKFGNGVVWRLKEYILDSPHYFRASITLIYSEPAKIQGDFSNLLETGKFSDVVLMADQETFKVHKNIISARSLVFRRMFENDMKENQEGKVEIEDIRGPVLGEMLKFMYTGKLTIASTGEPGVLEELHAAADKYDVQDLKEHVAEKLLKGVTAENVDKRLAIAEQFEDVDLKKKCLKVQKGESGSPDTSFDEDDEGRCLIC